MQMTYQQKEIENILNQFKAELEKANSATDEAMEKVKSNIKMLETNKVAIAAQQGLISSFERSLNALANSTVESKPVDTPPIIV